MNRDDKRNSEHGVVLLVVLIAVAILSILVVDFIYSTQIDTEIANNTKNDLQARYMSKSGVYVVAGTMKTRSLEELGGNLSLGDSDNLNSEGGWSLKFPSYPIGEGTLSVTVLDERSKINLNSLVSQNSNQVDQQVLAEITELFKILGVESGKSSLFIASLTNWLDRPIEGAQTQNDQDPSGATGGYYNGLPQPYVIKDGPLDTLDEIRLIDGMDDEFFSKIKDYVTVYPPDKKVNFSTASRSVLMAAIKAAKVSAIRGQGSSSSEDVTDEVAKNIAEAIIEARKENIIINRRKVSQIVREIDSTLNITAGLSGVMVGQGKSDTFTVISEGTSGDENPTISITRAVVRKAATRESQGVSIISWKED